MIKSFKYSAQIQNQGIIYIRSVQLILPLCNLKPKRQNNNQGLFFITSFLSICLMATLGASNRKMALYLVLNLKIILLTAKHMNILDAEEMAEVEKLLLLEQTHQPYTFLPLQTSLLTTLQNFTSSCFLPATPQIQQQTQSIVTNARKIKSISREDPNSSIKMFNRSVLAIIFPSLNPITKLEKQEINDSLLETIKCSLYSKDLNFNHIANKKMSVDNFQAKCMMSQFFHSLEVTNQFSNAQKIRYIEWSIENNQILQHLFILFYRIILNKLYVDGADDYERPLIFSQAITNLIEFFDINYRNFGQLFLIQQENYFLASVNKHFVLGEYVENGAYIGKESLKTTDEKLLRQSLGIPEGRVQSNNNNGAIEKDIKLFNFMLESGRSSQMVNEKNIDAETPHFKDSLQFAFGRKRKDEQQSNRQQEIKQQFYKLFMSSQAESIQESEPYQAIEEKKLTSLPLILSQQFQTKPRNSTENGEGVHPPQLFLLKKSTFQQSSIDNLEDQVKDQSKKNHKNIVMVKEKYFATFTPQIYNNTHCGGSNSFLNDGMFLDQKGDLGKSSSDQNVDNCVMCACRFKWIQNRRKRNKIASKVVDFQYFQPKTQRAPKFLQNLKYSQHLYPNNSKVRAFPKQSLTSKQYLSSKEIRKHSFLSFLKKNKQCGEKSHSSHSKSKKQIEKKSPSARRQKINHLQLNRQTINNINNKCTTFSTILSKNSPDVRPKFSTTKSVTKSTKRYQNFSPSKCAPANNTQSVIKNFDSKYFYHRPGLGTSWKYVENTISPNIEYRQQQPQSGIYQAGQNQKVRVYAPVNIIAPTVYFTGANEKDNRVIFTVKNDGESRERPFRTETTYFPRQRVVNPQVNNRYI